MNQFLYNALGYPDHDPEFTGSYFNNAVPLEQLGLKQLGDNNNFNNTPQDYSGFNADGNLTTRGFIRPKNPSKTNQPNVQIDSDIQERRAAAEASAEKKKKEKLTRRGLMAVATLLVAWAAGKRLTTPTYNKKIEDIKKTAGSGSQIQALEQVIGDTQVCRQGKTLQPGYFTGEYWKKEVAETTCWVGLSDEFVNLIKLSLGEDNVQRKINEYKGENTNNFKGYKGEDITIDQANELLALLTLRVEKAQTDLDTELERMNKEETDKTAITKWKEQAVELPELSEEEFNELIKKVQDKIELESLQLTEGNFHFGTADNAEWQHHHKTGGTRRKRHRRRKTKKHHKSKQKKTTRRVRRKHKKRQTRRKS